MKNIKELGLELIELEGDLLLVDENSKNQNIVNVQINGFRRVFEIIASTKLLEGIPLLVIEDEVENVFYQDNILDKEVAQHFFSLFKEGYNKAKEVFRFTEEDLKLAFEFGKHWALNYHEDYLDYIFGVKGCSKLNDQQANQAFADSRLKKELWIEVEEWSLAENVEAKNQNVPKIVNNQIKGIYR